MHRALYDSLQALEVGIQEMGQYPPDYFDKMCHKIPDAPSVDRVPWLLNRCASKVVLHIGCGDGPFDQALRDVTKRCYGIDKAPMRRPDLFRLDLDTMGCPLPQLDDVEMVLLAEILEHLLAPGLLLKQIRRQYVGRDIVMTAPNAFCPQPKLKQGYEMVNKDHTCWYSWQTLSVLVEKCGLTVKEGYWYHGKPMVAEGVIFVVG